MYENFVHTKVIGFIDEDYVRSPDDRKSTTCSCWRKSCTLVIQEAHNCFSIVKSEFLAMDDTFSEIIWFYWSSLVLILFYRWDCFMITMWLFILQIIRSSMKEHDTLRSIAISFKVKEGIIKTCYVSSSHRFTNFFFTSRLVMDMWTLFVQVWHIWPMHSNLRESIRNK